MRRALAFPSLLAGFIAPAGAVVLFQLEDFESPTAWTAGSPHPSPPAIQPDSGPDGTGDSSLRIAAVSELRILRNPDVSHRSGPGQRTLLVDNLRAVPEPGSALLLGLGLVFLNWRKR